MVFHEPMSGFAEAARALRTNIMFTAPDNPYKTLLITSAGPREGKTTVSCCIAIAMAQAGQRVILVDADLRRPRVHRIFGRGSGNGLSTALLDEAWRECAFETEVPNLSVMPAGPPPPNPAELLHSERFRSLLSELTRNYDRVIIDSPPVVAVTDAAILSTLCDGTVLVVRAYETSRELARQARRALQDVGCKTAGAVLNAVDLDRHEYKYYHYYYRRGDYYGSEGEAAPRRSDASSSSSAAPPTAH